MSRNQLRLAAVVIVVLMVVVAAHGLDHLPARLRGQIDAERAALATAQSEVRSLHNQVSGQAESHADLFGALAFGKQWPERFEHADTDLRSAAHDVDQLNRLEKDDRYSGREAVEALLPRARSERTQALASAQAIAADGAHWVDAAEHLPQQISAMERTYQAIHGFDLAPLTASVEHAAADWPEKKTDLEARLARERAMVAQADAAWQSSASLRTQAAAGKLTGADAGALLTLEESLQKSAADLPRQAADLQTLSAQLYVAWDKVLVDIENRHGQYQQKIRTVRTHVAGASAKKGEVSSDEQWQAVPRSTYDAMRNDLGMAIAHKPAGKYDSEAEQVAQPAGMAYVAPFEQGSNQYGYWDHRDGRDFWVFYGQYALLRDLLFNHDYRPFDRYEWEDYHNYANHGQTYYGHDAGTNAPKYGTQGTITQNRYASSNYARGGGFRDSPYASHSGNYRSSPYASPSARDPGADHSPRTFGHSAPEPHAAPPARTFHPAPARPPMRSPGRTFGRRH